MVGIGEGPGQVGSSDRPSRRNGSTHQKPDRRGADGPRTDAQEAATRIEARHHRSVVALLLIRVSTSLGVDAQRLVDGNDQGVDLRRRTIRAALKVQGGLNFSQPAIRGA